MIFIVIIYDMFVQFEIVKLSYLRSVVEQR